MARLEIPSIVVHNGSNSAPGSPTMERPLRTQRSLSKQAELEDIGDPVLTKTESNSGAGDRGICNDKSKSVSTLVDNNKTRNSSTDKKEKGRSNGVGPKAQEEEVKKNIGQGDEKPNPPLARARSNSKVKLLVRSHAMREATSPPPDPDSHSPPITQTSANSSNNNNNNNKSSSNCVSGNSNNTSTGNNSSSTNHNNNSLSVRPASRHKLNRQGSSRESMDSGASPCLSRDNSAEYTDSTGIDLGLFIVETINKNYKDRMMMFKIEQELITLIKDHKRTFHKFQPMSSYQRMLVHRVAAFFGMEHNVDSTGSAVVVSITKSTRIPEVPFREHVQGEMLYPEEPRRSILKRDSSSFEDANFKSPERQYSSEVRRSKSFEEREEEYEKARKRIFKCCDETGNEVVYIQSHESLHNSSHRSSHDELRWPGDIQPWSSSDSEPYRHNRFVHSDSNHLRTDRLCKGESFEGGDTLKSNSLRMSVSKSYSFGGYPVGGLSRGDSCTSTVSAGARLLTKQDSGSSMSSRISPSSSGYKSQSQRSDATMSATPSPTATPLSHSSGAAGGTSSQLLSPQGGTIIWAVCDIATVPPGCMLINPQTGLPITNPDGSIYRYDPAHPPKIDETKSVSTQITPLPSQPPSPAKTAATNETAKNTTTTSTSPSFPASPPPPTSQPGNHIVPYQPPSYQAPPYKSLVVPGCVDHTMSLPANTSQPQGVYQAPPYQSQPQVEGGGVYNSQQQCPPQPIVYSYNMNVMTAPMPYDQRPPIAVDSFASNSGLWIPDFNYCYPSSVDIGECTNPMCMDQWCQQENNMSVNELSGYFVGMNIMSDQQRGGGDASQTQGYQQNPQAMYWPPNNIQAQTGTPVYYSMPPQGAPMMTTSPPQHSQPGSAQNSPRYIAYPPYQQPVAQPDSRQTQVQGGYMGYGVAGYPSGTPLMNNSSECVSSMMYTSSNSTPYYAPAQQPSQPVQFTSPHRAPTPPQTPTHAQAMCGPPLVFLNGGTGFSPVYNPNPTNNGPTPPGPTQYMPHVMPNSGLFRPTMQMMRISPPPPPRPPRDGGAGSKPPYSRSPSVGSNKDRQYDNNDKMMRYSSVPLFRMVPGDMRGLALQQSPMSGGGMRMPYPLPPHAANHRPPLQHYQSDSNRFRKPRPKGLTYSPSNQSKPAQSQSSQQSSLNIPRGQGRTAVVNNGSTARPRQH